MQPRATYTRRTMMTPQQQRKIVVVLAVLVGFSMVVSLILPLLQ